MEFYTCIAKYAFFGIRDEKLLATARKSWYHTMVCSGIEAVITGLTRNRVGRFPEWPRKPLILLASSAFLHFFKTEYLRFFYALSTISTPGSQSAGNPQSLENTAWRCIEVVVTRLTRNFLSVWRYAPLKFPVSTEFLLGSKIKYFVVLSVSSCEKFFKRKRNYIHGELSEWSKVQHSKCCKPKGF